MHVRVSPPALATALRDSFRLQGLVSLLDEHGVVEVHDPRAASARDARLAITKGPRARVRRLIDATGRVAATATLIEV